MAPPKSEQALALALSRLAPHSDVLDVGAGDGMHSNAFMSARHAVTAVDIRPAPDWWPPRPMLKDDPGQILPGHYWIRDSFPEGPGHWRFVDPHKRPPPWASTRSSFGKNFDLVWCSHVLEHLPNVGAALDAMSDVLAVDGLLAVTVPPMKPEIVGGHVSLWNLGLLAYRLILAGFDCSRGSFGAYGYNLSAVIKADELIDGRVLDELAHDHGDIERLAAYFPPEWDMRQGRDGSTVPNVRWP